MNEKKKVLFFIDRWASGGIESFIINFIENNENTNYEFTIVTSTKESPLFDKKIEKLNIKFVELLDSFVSWYVRPLVMVTKFKRFVQKNDFDIYHFHIYNAVSLIFPLLLKNKARIIIHSHVADTAHDKTRWIKLLIHQLSKTMLLKRNYELIAVSNLAGRWMYGHKQFSIINNGIDTEKFEFSKKQRLSYREKFNIDQHTLVFLNIGRLNEQKNQITFINIIQRIKEYSADNVKGIIIGEGPLKATLELEIKKNNLENDIWILPVRNDISSIASMSDAFILPSIYEGLPLVGVEMQSNGLVCFFSKNIDKAIQITNNSFLIDIDESAKKNAMNIIEHLNNNDVEEREKLSYIVKKNGYDIKTTVKSIIDIYDGRNKK